MKKNNQLLLFFFSIWGILAVVFAFTDLAISQKFANLHSGWAAFMEDYGQLPGALVAFVGSSTLLAIYKLNRNLKSVWGMVGLSVLTLLIGLMFWVDALGAQNGEINISLGLILAVIMTGAAQYILRRLRSEDLVQFKPIATIAVVLLFAAGIATVWAIKIPWGRWTYRDILEVGDLSLFTRWYLPQGNNGHHSFISGHTAMGFSVLPIVLLFRKNKTQYLIAWALALAWGVIVAASRVVIGAHFAADVLFGGCQTVLWFCFLNKKFLRPIT